MTFFMILVLLVGLIALAIWLYIAHQGDAEFEFAVNQRTEFILLEASDASAVFSCKVPFVNKGTQDGTIMDAYTRHLLPKEQYDGVEVHSRLELEIDPRTDGYWEAVIIPKTTGQSVVVTLIITAKSGDIVAALAEMPEMSVDIVYQVVARSDWYITKAPRISLEAAELRQALESGQESN